MSIDVSVTADFTNHVKDVTSRRESLRYGNEMVISAIEY